ncbi:hypothetical protein M427DRAFT_121847 [Gonapodya prolifera JEL478]|uniref:Chromatin-remodeling ATPase INO80 n=1 Tax=Gonapodya prolifera (strain JEL478) TaxID=1344416 RepID=A0A139AMX0_GONPJ|nr:hypothetical protein M427DRAFT_121847 [Gonapodya prolifera JEL478]|eukprot:KXS17805.1 hypothetical protein M427DRAFT_121847 [Gonapodya prolifera JEL478]
MRRDREVARMREGGRTKGKKVEASGGNVDLDLEWDANGNGYGGPDGVGIEGINASFRTRDSAPSPTPLVGSQGPPKTVPTKIRSETPRSDVRAGAGSPAPPKAVPVAAMDNGAEEALRRDVGEEEWVEMREGEGGRRWDAWREVLGGVGEASLQLTSVRTGRANVLRRLSQQSVHTYRRWGARLARSSVSATAARSRKIVRELASFWRRNEREERDRQKRAEREAVERRRKEEEEREAKRAGRKLEFLIRQTELYSHFVAKKRGVSGGAESAEPAGPVAIAGGKGSAGSVGAPAFATGASASSSAQPSAGGNSGALDFDTASDDHLAERAESEAKAAAARTLRAAQMFDEDHRKQQREAEAQLAADAEMASSDEDEEEKDRKGAVSGGATLADAVDAVGFGSDGSAGMGGGEDVPQPRMLTVQLKPYQLKGLNWLVNLYEQGINGILADEMGLGKTIQSISLMAYLAETHDIWGPFLVVAPVSTLHNWQQEISRFVPSLRVLPYWGNANDRKVLRQFWQRKKLRTRDAPFHVLVTSYQLILTDETYFQKLKWQYLILDEAQAIKSSSSLRWNVLLKFNCRNRLLLTGTPIQNSMQELWALLHFIMPTFFDSHTEFSEWFSKDIEAHSKDSKASLNADQLRRLHMILRPFMLRRIKRDVETELGEKVERDVLCPMTLRQKRMYEGLREKISLQELLQKAELNEKDVVSSLMNIVMQLRKVCNHPELFARAEVRSPFQVCVGSGRLATPAVGRGGDIEYWVNEAPESPIRILAPRILYDEGLLTLAAEDGQRMKSLSFGVADHLRNIWRPEYIAETLKCGTPYGAFDFSRVLGVSPEDISELTIGTPAQRAVRSLLLAAKVKPNPLHRSTDSLRHFILQSPLDDRFGSTSNVLGALATIGSEISTYSILRRRPVFMPAVLAPPPTIDISSYRFAAHHRAALQASNVRALLFDSSWLPGVSPILDENLAEIREQSGLRLEAGSKQGFTNVWIPNPIKIVTDSAKMQEIDPLLARLKSEGHRVLIFFQMTKMIDLFEEYCSYRNYRYLRLDGSTAITDRNAMVVDWQTKPEHFIFLLSTRAGGLGINLTAADTVIFYDSDWNPTVDQQAMDRCHRLGQTKTVTVYRLITRGTIEERIQIRTKQKTQVQKVVISGGEFEGTVEFKPREIASLLMDDGEMDTSVLGAAADPQTIKSQLLGMPSKPKRGRPRKNEEG